MRQTGLLAKFFFVVALAVGGTNAAEAGSFTLGLKAWGASLSADGLDGGEELVPGLSVSWGVTNRVWLSAGYLEREIDFTLSVDETTSGSIKEVDSDIIVGWSFTAVDVGLGYRFTEFTTRISAAGNPTSSSGPMVFLGGGDLFGGSRWGYYWGLASMFEDLDDADGRQTHFNGEAGFHWTAPRNVSLLMGYRYKRYSGTGSLGLTISGPVVNLAYTFR